MRFDCFPVTHMEQNCSVLWCETTRKAAVIDPGGDLWMLTNLLECEGLVLERILVTHGHCDHAGGAAELARLSGAPVEGPHCGDAHLVRGLAEAGKSRGIPARDFEPVRWLRNGESVCFGEISLRVLHCPGHTRGHVAYFHEASRVAFVGDILFRGAIGAWEHPDGNLGDLVHSIRCRLFPLGDDVRFVPGHGPMSTFGEEKNSNPFVADDTEAVRLLPPTRPTELP